LLYSAICSEEKTVRIRISLRDHTCPLKPVIFKPVEDVRRTVSENLTLTPSQIRSNIILSMMKQRRDWASIEKAGIETQKMDLK